MKHSDSTNCKGRDIYRSIINLAWPAILSNLTVPLLGLSDTFISGHIGEEKYLAAMAVAATLVNSVYWMFGFLRMGTAGLTANAYGAADSEEQAIVFTRSIAIALGVGLLLFILSPLTGRGLVAFMNPPDEVAPPALQYFVINMAGAPALLATTAAYGRLTGRQNTLYPMITAVTVNVINIALSMLLVFCLGIGFRGVAIGTTTANWCGFILVMLLTRRESRGERMLTSLRTALHSGGMPKFFSTNSFLFMRSACMMAVTFSMTYFASSMGTATLAVNAILTQFFLFYSFFTDGFAYSAEALCGSFEGAGNREMLKQTINRLAVIGCIMALLFAVAYGFGAPRISYLLSDSHTVEEAVQQLLPVCIMLPIASTAAFLLDGIFIGLTRTAEMLLSTLCGMIVFYMVYKFGLGAKASAYSPISDQERLWWAFNVFLAMRGIVLYVALYYSPHRSIFKHTDY